MKKEKETPGKRSTHALKVLLSEILLELKYTIIMSLIYLVLQVKEPIQQTI